MIWAVMRISLGVWRGGERLSHESKEDGVCTFRSIIKTMLLGLVRPRDSLTSALRNATMRKKSMHRLQAKLLCRYIRTQP
jgi:hypothetical protein